MGTFNDTDEPQKHYSKCKKPEKTGYILYNSIYLKCPEKEICGDRKQIGVLRLRESEAWLQKGTKELFGVMEMF